MNFRERIKAGIEAGIVEKARNPSGRFSQRYMDLCAERDRCINHFDRPAVPVPDGWILRYGSTRACKECWTPKRRSQLLRQVKRLESDDSSYLGWCEQWAKTCAYCGDASRKLTHDHVVPVSRGGGGAYSNVVPACFACNRAKSARLLWLEWVPLRPTLALLEAFPPPQAA